jgi:hypothetical protein
MYYDMVISTMEYFKEGSIGYPRGRCLFIYLFMADWGLNSGLCAC